MATSVVPNIIDALVSLGSAALDVDVVDGYGISGDPDAFLMVGVEDPDSQDAASSADSSQRPATMGNGRSRDEEGDIRCVAWACDGGGDQKVARDAAYAIAAQVANLCRSNPSLGLSAGGSVVTSYGTDQTLRQDQNTQNGAEAALFFSVHFRARL